MQILKEVCKDIIYYTELNKWSLPCIKVCYSNCYNNWHYHFLQSQLIMREFCHGKCDFLVLELKSIQINFYDIKNWLFS